MRGLALLIPVALAACGDRGGGDGPAPAAPKARTEAETRALLASLPAPYNGADLENGQRVFARCRACHTIAEGGPNMTGPNLHGVFGRQAGTAPKYTYTKAVQQAGFAWDAERLDHWLQNPRTFLPGNKMSFPGLPDATDRRDVIAYLKVETGYAPQPRQPAS
jgi:cytochrome c